MFVCDDVSRSHGMAIEFPFVCPSFFARAADHSVSSPASQPRPSPERQLAARISLRVKGFEIELLGASNAQQTQEILLAKLEVCDRQSLSNGWPCSCTGPAFLLLEPYKFL